MATYVPRIMQRGESIQIADSASEYTRLRFDGYFYVGDAPVDIPISETIWDRLADIPDGFSVNADGHLVVTQGDGDQLDAGLVRGPQGAPGGASPADVAAAINDASGPAGMAVAAKIETGVAEVAGPHAVDFQTRTPVAGARAGGVKNELSNPRLATSASGWSTSGFGTGGAGTAVRVADAWGPGENAWVSTWSADASGGSTAIGAYNDRVPVTPGEVWMGSDDIESTTAITARHVVGWFTAASGGSPASVSVYDVPVPANKRTRLAPDVAAVAPAGATHVATYTRIENLAGIVAGTVIKVGRASLTRGRNLKPYRDSVITASTRAGFLVCWGDSMTQNNHGGGTSFPDRLSTELGVPALNRGRGGEAAWGIGVRQGGVQPLITFPGDQIPASGSATVTVADSGYLHITAAWGYYGSVAGVEGTLTRAATTGVWTFARAVDGAAVDLVPGGSPFAARTTSDYGDAAIIWAGANDIDNGDEAATIAYIGAMVERARANGQAFVVMSVLNPAYGGDGTAKHQFVIDVNAALAARYGSAFLDVRRYLIDRGLTAAGISPTSGDTTAIADDRIPPSLMFDDIHLNDTGRGVVAKFVGQFLRAHVLGPVPSTETMASGSPDLTVYDAQLTPLRAGYYYAGAAGAVSTGQLAEGSLRGSRLLVGRTCTLDTIAVEVTTAGSAGALVRVGLYLYDPASNSGTLLVDGGTVDATTTGVKTVTISQAVTKGQILVLASAVQGGASTRPIVRVNGGYDPTIGDASAATVVGNSAAGFNMAAGVSGALPASPSGFGMSVSNGVARLAVKAA